jgi:cytoskeletal protein CcmA (bactofilin family)
MLKVPDTSEPAPKPRRKTVRERLSGVNIYLLIFIFLVVLAFIIIGIAYLQSHKNSVSNVKTQTLTQDDLRKISSTDTTIGSNQTILNVQSSAVFAGKVLIREGLEVAGNLTVGGTLGISNLTVSGTTQLGQAQVNKNLSVAGDTALQGAVTIAKSLQVNGGANIGGALSAPQITTANLQLSGDLVITKHIVAGGATPGKTNGTALGSGGTASVSGSDTAGTVNINTGGGPGAGCFATINFTSKYNSTPRVLITPVGASAGAIDYYVNRGSTNFSICTSTAPPAGASFAFDYFVIN